MSEHLRQARELLNKASARGGWDMNLPTHLLAASTEMILSHLEAQQETPASETSSAPTTGPAEKLWALSSATRGASTASLAATSEWFHLTVRTGDSTKSISYTLDEWAAIHSLFSGQRLTSPSPIHSGETKAGDPGPAVPDFPALSSEPAQGGSEAELRVGFDSILYWLDAIREINAGHEGHYQYPLSNIHRIASHYAKGETRQPIIKFTSALQTIALVVSDFVLAVDSGDEDYPARMRSFRDSMRAWRDENAELLESLPSRTMKEGSERG